MEFLSVFLQLTLFRVNTSARPAGRAAHLRRLRRGCLTHAHGSAAEAAIWFLLLLSPAGRAAAPSESRSVMRLNCKMSHREKRREEKRGGKITNAIAALISSLSPLSRV